MDEKKKEISVNVSSGAEKVESITRQSVQNDGDERLVKTEVVTKSKRLSEEDAAKARVAAALKKQEEKKRKQEEKERKRQERARQKANRKREKERGSNKGYGGWIAAVVSLGVVTLALGATVTVGAIDMAKTKNGVTAGYRATTYELVGIMENVDDDLDRARLSNSPVQQGRILTDLLVQARLAELDLEKMPIAAEADAQLTTFINRVGKESERMLAKLRRGEKLSEKDGETLSGLYKTGHAMRAMLDEYAAKMDDKDIMGYIKDGTGALADVLNGLEELTLTENRATMPKPFEDKMGGAGIRRTENDGGFSYKIDTAQAEEKCLEYFADYPIAEYQCVGETIGNGYKAYNVQGYDDKGTLLFAEIDSASGALVKFNYYEDCKENTFDLQNAQMLAENFLEKLGYTQMQAMRVRENGTDGDFTFVFVEDGVAYYPDAIRVKVCRNRGMVTGLDATAFMRNHRERNAPQVSISLDTAMNGLHKDLQVNSWRLAAVHTARGERTAYEFICSFEEENYLVYVDAVTGDEISIVNVKNVK